MKSYLLHSKVHSRPEAKKGLLSVGLIRLVHALTYISQDDYGRFIILRCVLYDEKYCIYSQKGQIDFNVYFLCSPDGSFFTKKNINMNIPWWGGFFGWLIDSFLIGYQVFASYLQPENILSSKNVLVRGK